MANSTRPAPTAHDVRPCLAKGEHILTQRHGHYECPVAVRGEHVHKLCQDSMHFHREFAGHGICDDINQYWELDKLRLALKAVERHTQNHIHERHFSSTLYPGSSREERTLNHRDLIEVAYIALGGN